MDVRLVDTEIWINEIAAILNEGKQAPLNVTGNSMLPFLKHGRDRVLLEAFVSPAKTGDILLYRRSNGLFVLHRVVKCDGNKLWFAGDIQSVVEGPLDESCVIGKVIKACRNGKWIESGDFEWDFFEKAWIKTLPRRHLLVKAHLIYRKIFR